MYFSHKLFFLSLVTAFYLLATTHTAYAADILAAFNTQTLVTPDGKKMNCHQRLGVGRTLVLVPGTWGDIHRFEPLLAELPSDIPVVVIELCWQGGNQPPTLELSIEQLADEVLWAIEKLKLDNFFVGGHSIGGMITVEIAGREVPGLVGAIPMEGWTHHTVVKTAFEGVVVGKLTPQQELLRQASRARGRKHLSEKQLHAISSIWRQWNGYAALERSQVPILHVWGDRSKPRPSRAALQIPDRLSIEILWIPNASHKLVMQSPKFLADSLLDFMRRSS